MAEHRDQEQSTAPTRAEMARQRERRYIYNGETSPVPSYPLRTNRRGVRRKVSTFNLIAVLLVAGCAVVVYVNNVITINRLVQEVSELQQRYDAILNANATLRAEITRKAERERIGTIAIQQLGLRYPSQQPDWMVIDEEKQKELTGR